MKLPFTICGSRLTTGKQSATPAAADRKSKIANRNSERGIALIITLILLSVTLVMALAFMAISSREHGAVRTSTDAATARLGADSALANAEARIISSILSTTNPYNFGLIVSTNYPPYAFNNLADFTNLLISPRAPVFVSIPAGNQKPAGYDFRFYLDLNRNGRFDSNGIVANMDNTGATNGTYSFQVGDPEWIGVLERPDAPYGPDNQFVARYAFIALPAGNALDVNAIHNQTLIPQLNYPANPMNSGDDSYFRNQGVGSWEINLAAFLTDLNTNEWDPTADPYSYQEWMQPNQVNRGRGFEDAFTLLSYRYANNYNSLASVQYLYGANGTNAFGFDGIDGYSDGPLQTSIDTNEDVFFVNNDNPTLPWAGANNTNHFFTPDDMLDPAKTFSFSTNLINTGTNFFGGATNSTYDSYTFYRLLSQLGTESAPESGKMNLNYDNLDPGSNGVLTFNGTPSATNFVPWTPLGFFTNAADRLLRAYTANWINQNFRAFTNTFGASTTNAFGIGNIPVYVNGQFTYTPAVNRLLQLAANIYDATASNRTNNGSLDYPDVFRPLFSRDAKGTGTNIYITGYTNVVSFTDGMNDPQLLPVVDIPTFSASQGVITNLAYNIYGVPWIIGAKKGFPNFNEFSMENNLAVTRRLQLTRMTNNSPSVPPTITGTNQMYLMSLNSSIGVELWNSYAASYPGTIVIGLSESASLLITNDDPLFNAHPGIAQPITFYTNNFNAPYVINSWPGTGLGYGGNPNASSFVITTFTGPTLTNAVYRSPYASGATLPNVFLAPCLIPTNYFGFLGAPLLFETNSAKGFHFPQFGVVMTNRLQVFMLDYTNGVYRVVDYVHFAGPDSAYNVNANLADINITVNGQQNVGVWDTNIYTTSGTPIASGLTHGIVNQVAISKSGSPPEADGLWQADPQAVPQNGTAAQQQAFFQAFFLKGNHYGTTTNLQLSVQAPYSPTRYIVQYITWQANDPLVHYLASDIAQPPANTTTMPKPGLNHSSDSAQTFSPLTSLNLGRLNDRYTPWGGNPTLTVEQRAQVDPNAYNTAERDPMAVNSDSWDFPTNKLPTVGWLGRVHRGTPWQTVYLKSTDLTSVNGGPATWQTWTGDGNQFDAVNAAPVQDHLLFDLFTTAFNDNATRGQLSVNVAANLNDPESGLAAWSALFSGVVVLTNNPFTGIVTATNIQPAGVYDPAQPPPVVRILQGINAARRNKKDGVNGAFEHIGDILRAPQLTEQSPFINTSAKDVNGNPIFPNDEVMEWLPQQTMSLLRLGTPRYVIYSWGQTLKPATGGIVTAGGNFFGMVTNYQVVSEFATRAVVHFNSTETNILGTNSVINNRAVIEQFNVLPPD